MTFHAADEPIRFSEWLATYAGGALDSRLTAALNETADAVALLDKGGSVSLKLTLTPQGGGVVVTGKVAHAAPQPKEIESIANPSTICTYVLDDLTVDTDDGTINRRAHKASLQLRPTVAARRWAAALACPLTQAEMVELVIDGVTEIADPPGADLRDLVRDLQAVRTSTAKSVVHTDGGFAISIGEEVQLSAGRGETVAVPEAMTVVFIPWTVLPAQQITIKVKIRPQVTNAGTVVFALEAPTLEDALNDVLAIIHTALAANEDEGGTGIAPYRCAS